jgi:radical SAM superfamily enzyme YgiQ (UPF0313 family)
MEMNTPTRILLVYPNFHYFPGWLENRLNYKQVPLGLAYLASSARKKHSVDVRICDASFLDIKEDAVVQYAREFRPDIVGMAAYTPTMGFIRRVAASLRRSLPESLIVFGGPHVTALPFENLDVADLCILGEGERTFEELVDRFIGKRPFETIAGLSLKKDGRCVRTGERELIEDLDSIPFPARDLYPLTTYSHIYPYRLGNPFYSAIVTSRGCGYDCSFCSNKLMWKRRVRVRSLDNVFAEIEVLVRDYKISLLRIGDDNFITSPDRVVQFCRMKRRFFPELKWFCHARADALTPTLIKEMKAGGCVETQIGVESGDDLILGRCNKRATTAVVRKSIRALRNNGINVWATCIIGNEGDTPESVEKTIRFAQEADPTYCSFMFLSPLPGTRSHENMSRKGYIKTKDWSRYSWHGQPVIETPELSRIMLVRLRKRAYRKFYLRPKIIYRYMRDALHSRQWATIFSDALLLLKFVLGSIG